MCSYTKLKEAVEQRLPLPTAVQVTGIGTYPQDDELMYCLFVCHKALGKYIFTAETFEGTYLITHSRKVCVCLFSLRTCLLHLPQIESKFVGST